MSELDWLCGTISEFCVSFGMEHLYILSSQIDMIL